MGISIENQDRQFEGLEYQTDRSAIRIQYAFASAAGRSDSGHYTCSSTVHPNQTALVTVLGNSKHPHPPPRVNLIPRLVDLLYFPCNGSLLAGM